MIAEWKRFIDLLHLEVVPALGCTEPAAVALCASKAAETLGVAPDSLDVVISGNLMKNGMGVVVPGTSGKGLNLAAAIGALGGKSNLRLEVLKDITLDQVVAAKNMVDEKRVRLSLADNDILLFCSVTARKGSDSATVVLQDEHTNIVSIARNGQTLFNVGNKTSQAEQASSSPLTVAEIYTFAGQADLENLKFIQEAVRMNMAVAEEGLRHAYGLGVGKFIDDNIRRNIQADDLTTYAVKLTTAATDARMDGVMLPVMSNSGSGNQGLTCTLPVVACADRLGKSEEELTRALIISHLVSIHIKSLLGRLSALCGAMVAGTASGCGIVFLLGGGLKEMEMTIRTMVGNMAGMICDGAKGSCALKVASAVGAGVQAALLAMEGTTVPGTEGIVDENIETCIGNLARLGSVRETDRVILDIMIKK